MYQLRFKLSIKRMAMEFGHGQNFTLQNMRAVLYIYIYQSMLNLLLILTFKQYLVLIMCQALY